MSTPVLADGSEVRTSPAPARPLLLGSLAALSTGAAAIHFAVMFEHFSEYFLYGVFFLVLSWAQLTRAIVLIGLPLGPDTTSAEAWGPLDIVCAIEEILLVIGAGAVLVRSALMARPVRYRSQTRSLAGLLAVPVVVIAATTAVMTPGWAGSEGPEGMASGSPSSSSTSMSGSTDSLQGGMGDMGSTDGQPDMKMYGNTNAPTAAQVVAAAALIKETGASLVRFENVNVALARCCTSGSCLTPAGVFSDDLATSATTAAAQAALAETKPGQPAP